MSSHHPSPDLLRKFADADLDGSMSSVVSAHVEHCSSCKKWLTGLEQELSSRAFSAHDSLSSSETLEAWKNVSALLGANKGVQVNSVPSNSIELLGMTFELPQSLRQFASKPLNWMPFGKGGRICKLGQEKGKALFLIYLSPNEEVPFHSHEGMEYSYVVSGNYAADGLQFETGDFSSSTQEVAHAPKAGSEDGCLLLSSVENRLNFLQGWLKPFNGLLWWILSVRVK